MLKSIVSGDNENIDVISVVAGNTSTDGRSSSVINEDVIKCEILTGLPVKSLMRFKCVSKSWLSLIEEDPSFTDLHLARPALLLVIPRTPRRDPNNPYNLNLHRNIHDQLVLTANLIRDQGSEGEVHSTRKIKSSQSSGILGPVNGLVCFVNQDKSVVCVYNLSTRERTPGVKSTLHLPSEEQSAGFSLHKIYQFGFDPVTKKHKVLCICHRLFQHPGQLSTYADNQVCEVLTVGDNAWRRIDEFLPWGIDYILPSSVYVNGYIYYCTDKFLSCSWYGGWQNGDAVLVAFDVSIEKFRTITIPNLILRSPPSDDWFNQHADLLEVNGHRRYRV
ncbi:putative F-box protein At1g32420 [Papaver somniferum]|uniref:putative F-box protein At1g32420 n=1 Tax=Papaver somniferum TaxID=3469 RepID=UPI000E6FCA81|nr:putative F-box protein At1g32420 [Papaver somniferum]